MGGVPLTRENLNGGLTNISEGFADYFATQVCLKEYFRNNFSGTVKPRIPRIEDACRLARDTSLCVNVLNAAFDMMNVIQAQADSSENVDFNLPETNLTESRPRQPTVMGIYPTPRCRFDILIAGALCEKSGDVPCGYSGKGLLVDNKPGVAVPPKCFLDQLNYFYRN